MKPLVQRSLIVGLAVVAFGQATLTSNQPVEAARPPRIEICHFHRDIGDFVIGPNPTNPDNRQVCDTIGGTALFVSRNQCLGRHNANPGPGWPVQTCFSQ